MQLRIQIPSGVEAVVKAVTMDGKEVQIREIFIEPVFFKPNGRPNTVYFETQDRKGRSINKYIGTMGGQTGDFRLDKRSPSTPRFDAERYDKTSFGEAEEAEAPTKSAPVKSKPKRRALPATE